MENEDRYSRQIRFAPIGIEGQRKIGAARITLMGAGALGSVAAELLVRAGAGFVRLIDRDVVELSNLQRQTLYDEEDVQRGLPKAAAAAAKLRRINSQVVIEPVIDDINPTNVESYIRDVDLVLDALDNFETRFVINDACFRHQRNWIYAAAVGSYGLVLPIAPGRTPCLRCLIGSLPAPGSSPTCDSAGVIGSITHVIASLQIAEALKIIVGAAADSFSLVTCDVWSQRFQRLAVGTDVMKACPLCAEGRFDYLEGEPLRTVTLCGRNAVQLIPAVQADIDFTKLAATIGGFAAVQFNEFVLKCTSSAFELTLFKDGRAIIKGTEDAKVARSVYSKMVGM